MPSAQSEQQSASGKKPIYVARRIRTHGGISNESGQAQVENLLAQALKNECVVVDEFNQLGRDCLYDRA